MAEQAFPKVAEQLLAPRPGKLPPVVPASSDGVQIDKFGARGTNSIRGRQEGVGGAAREVLGTAQGVNKRGRGGAPFWWRRPAGGAAPPKALAEPPRGSVESPKWSAEPRGAGGPPQVCRRIGPRVQRSRPRIGRSICFALAFFQVGGACFALSIFSNTKAWIIPEVRGIRRPPRSEQQHNVRTMCTHQVPLRFWGFLWRAPGVGRCLAGVVPLGQCLADDLPKPAKFAQLRPTFGQRWAECDQRWPTFGQPFVHLRRYCHNFPTKVRQGRTLPCASVGSTVVEFGLNLAELSKTSV